MKTNPMRTDLFPNSRIFRHNNDRRAKSTGLTLIELLISLVLGIFLVGGVLSVYLSTQQNFKVTENLARIQESARFATEQMGRELREAGSNPCGVRAVANVVRTGGVEQWWANWDAGTLVGYEAGSGTAIQSIGTAENERVAGTDAIAILRTQFNDDQLRTIQSHDATTTAITLNSTTNYDVNDVVFGCDLASGAIFEISAKSGLNIEHGQWLSASNGNCTTTLGWPQTSSCGGTTSKVITPGGFVTKYDPGFWYIGNARDGTRSLYRMTQTNKLVGGNRIQTSEPREMVTHVHDMQIQYLLRDNSLTSNNLASDWVDANDPQLTTAEGWSKANSKEVVAVRVTLTYKSPNTVAEDRTPLTRTSVAVVNLRNRDVKP
jgi:type IV pilus assembly protein PilW